MVSVLPARIEVTRQTIRQQPRFASNPVSPLIAEIAHEGIANKIAPLARAMSSTGLGKLGGLSFEDWAARLLTIFGIYIPQGFIAIKENKHKWETNGRNALVWTMTLGLTMLVKNDKFSTNTLLNFFMKNGQAAAAENPTAGPVKRFFNKLKLNGDYFDILKSAKIDFKEADRAKAHWSNLDKNVMDTIGLHLKELAAKTGISDAEKSFLKLANKFVFRRNLFNVLSTGIITLLTMYVIGRFAMELVFRFIAPLDHDFDPARSKPGAKPSGKQPNSIQPTQPHRQPGGFQVPPQGQYPPFSPHQTTVRH